GAIVRTAPLFFEQASTANPCSPALGPRSQKMSVASIATSRTIPFGTTQIVPSDASGGIGDASGPSAGMGDPSSASPELGGFWGAEPNLPSGKSPRMLEQAALPIASAAKEIHRIRRRFVVRSVIITYTVHLYWVGRIDAASLLVPMS